MNKILETIEQTGKLPWECPFIKDGVPRNHVTGKTYRGRNLLMLMCAQFSRNEFMTYLQAQKLGGNVKKGEHGFPILYAQQSQIIKDEETGDIKKIIKGCAKLYYVFNVSQIENLPEVTREEDAGNYDINKFIKNINPEIKFGYRSFYNLNKDFIGMPYVNECKSESEYYAVLFHELVHWTGATKRLNRYDTKNINIYTEEYSYEELVAELGSALLRAQFKIDSEKMTENSAAYLTGWLSVFKSDKEMLFKAMADAERAVEYLNSLAVNTMEAEPKEATA